MKKAKKCVIMLLTVAMVIGSMSVVMAGSDTGTLYVTPSCTAYCDVWCDGNFSTASTHLYVDRSYDSVSASASITVTGGRELNYRVLGTDSVTETSISDLRVLADAEANYTEVPYKAVSSHSASVGLSSRGPLSLEAMFD